MHFSRPRTHEPKSHYPFLSFNHSPYFSACTYFLLYVPLYACITL